MKKDNRIFVFGSNLGGRHGKGAALFAKRYRGAYQGQCEGLQGQSYGIPTKDRSLKPLPLELIHFYVERFKAFAEVSPHLAFQLTPVGCGYAGYSPVDIAWMFKDAPDNVDLPGVFADVLFGSQNNC